MENEKGRCLYIAVQLNIRAANGEMPGVDRTSLAIFDLHGQHVGNITFEGRDYGDLPRILSAELNGQQLQVQGTQLRGRSVSLTFTFPGGGENFSPTQQTISYLMDKGIIKLGNVKKKPPTMIE